MPHADSDTLAELFQTHGRFLQRLARDLIGDAELAQDVVQEAWVRALERPPRSQAALPSWLATTVGRLASNERRGNARRTIREMATARPEAQESHAERLARLDTAQSLLAEARALRATYEQVVWLRYFEGLEPRLIAQRLGLPVKTVRTRLARALTELRERLDAREEGARERWLSALLPLARSEECAAGELAAGATSGVAVGGIVLNKVMLFAAAALVLLLAWRVGGIPSGISQGEAETLSAEGSLLAIDRRPAAPPRALVLATPEGLGRASVELPKPRPFGWGSLIAHFKWERDSSPASGLVVMTSEEAWPPVEPVVRETDATGTVRFEALPAGRTALTLTLGHSFRDIEVVADEEQVIELLIPRTRVVRGRVIDAAGEPFPGADIWGIRITSRCPAPAALTRSASDGSFFLGDVGWLTYVSARSPGHRPSLSYFLRSDPPLPLAGVEVCLQLGPPGGRVRGRVLDELGQGIPKVEVRVGLRGAGRVVGPDDDPAWESIGLPIFTDALGDFRVPHDLAAGTQVVSALAPGWEFWKGELEVRTGETTDFEINLDRASRVTGMVLNLSGEAVAGVRVAASHTRGWFSPRFPASGTPWTTTDHNGRFTLESMPPGRQPIQASARGPSQRGRAREWVECSPGQTHEIELILDPGATLRGVLVDSGHTPLSEWSVWIEEVTGTTSHYRSRAITDQEGRFLVANLDADSSYDLRVNGPGELYMHPRAWFRGSRPDASELIFVVQNTSPATGQIHGRVELDLAVEGPTRMPPDLAVICRKENSGGHLYPELDRASGRFQLGGLTPGRYCVDVHRASVDLTTSGPYEVRADEKVDVGVLSVPGVGGLQIVIPAIPEADLVDHWAELVERLPDGSLRERDVDVPFVQSEGMFLSPPVPAGTWRVQVDAAEWFIRPRDLRIEDGQTLSVELEAEPAIDLELRLEFPAHLQRIDWYEISLRDPHSSTVEPWLWHSAEDLNEEHSIETWCVAPPGDWIIEVRAEGDLSGSLPITVDELAAEQSWTIVLR